MSFSSNSNIIFNTSLKEIIALLSKRRIYLRISSNLFIILTLISSPSSTSNNLSSISKGLSKYIRIGSLTSARALLTIVKTIYTLYRGDRYTSKINITLLFTMYFSSPSNRVITIFLKA